MTFYSISYLTTHQRINQLFNYLAIILFATLIIIMLFLYLCHRFLTRYRDIGIIFSSFHFY